MSHLEILLIAIVLDAFFGDPNWLWNRLSHPTAIMGALVALLDRHLNKGKNRKLKGVFALFVMLSLSGFVATAIGKIPFATPVEIILTAILLAQNSLAKHITAIARALEIGLAEARRAVALVVGRDAKSLDENAIARSAIESAAENFSDGFLAPAFWALLFGLPGIMIYKMINTADSMIGYKNDRYTDFGWAAARLDDLVNWIPARLSGLLIVLAHGSKHAFDIMRSNAPLHRSPNAGWPESAAAAVLGVAISGPRTYDGVASDDPFVNPDGRYDLIPADIDRVVKVIWRAWGLCLVLLGFIWCVS